MATFVLTKYKEKIQEQQVTEKNEDGTVASPSDNVQEPDKDQSIMISGSVAEIVANALNKMYAKKVEIEEVPDQGNPSTDGNLTAISTEDINSNPVAAFASVKPNDIVYIENKGFATTTEEWFLMNLPNKTPNVFYTVESLAHHIGKVLGVTPVEG